MLFKHKENGSIIELDENTAILAERNGFVEMTEDEIAALKPKLKK